MKARLLGAPQLALGERRPASGSGVSGKRGTVCVCVKESMCVSEGKKGNIC